MDKHISNIFQKLQELEPPEDIKSEIMSKITLERHTIENKRLLISYSGFVGSLISIVWISITVGQSLIRSEFWSFLSLLFTDAAIVMRNWNEFLFSLLENAPTLHLIALLAPIFTFMLSLNYYFGINKRGKHNYI